VAKGLMPLAVSRRGHAAGGDAAALQPPHTCAQALTAALPTDL